MLDWEEKLVKEREGKEGFDCHHSYADFNARINYMFKDQYITSMN